MRIIGGRWRGHRLASFGKGDTAAHLRPTPDRVRESLFSVLDGGRFGSPLEDAVVLDVFAGTGALGLEAMSRGASKVTFVEKGRTALNILRENVEKTRAEGVRIVTRDATRLPANTGTPASLVFLDPPYGKSLGAAALASAISGNWLAREALIVWEEASAQVAPDGFSLLETKSYGQTTITLLRCL